MKYNKQIYLGTDPATGKMIRKWIHAETSEELKKKIRQAKNEHDLTPNTSDITFQEYSGQWFAAYKSNRSGKTREMYNGALKKCQNLDRYPLKSITKTACQQILNELWKTPRMAEIVRTTLRQIFKSAIADGIILRNPADGLTIPDHKRTEKHLLTEKELDAVRSADLNTQDRLFVDLLLIFGLRPAEALALQPLDFDLRKKTLRISHALEMTNDNKSRIKDTKTGITREIPIPDALIPRLRSYFANMSGFLLFGKQDNTIHTKSSYRKMCARIMKAINKALGGDDRMNLTSRITMYSFRHARATELYYLCQQGIISPKKAAAMLGHSEEIFLKIYSHIREENEQTEQIYPSLKPVINL